VGVVPVVGGARQGLCGGP